MNSTPSPSQAPNKGHRLWMLYGIIGLTLVAYGLIAFQPELERNMKSLANVVITAVGFLLAVIWFVVFSRTRWQWRVGLVGVLLLLGWGASKTLKVEGTVDGTGAPKVVWKWTQPAAPSRAVVLNRVGVTNTTLLKEGIKETPQLLGPARDGVLRGTLLGTNWAAQPPKQLWRQPIGRGWSAFSVVGDLAYTQEQQESEEWVSCFEVTTGIRRWTATNSARFSEWQGGDGPRATPTIHDGLLYAYGATGTLDCLEAATGRRLWRRQVLQEHKLDNLIWGVSASPLVWDDLVIVTGGFNNHDTVIAYHRMTGEPAWSVGRDKASYASPVAAVLNGETVILSVNAASLSVHEPRSGKVLLDYDWPTEKWPKAAQPVVAGTNQVFLSAGYGVGCVLLQLAKDSSGKWVAEQVWKNMMMKTQFNTPGIRDGHLYGLDDGLLACVDLATGKRQWKDGRFGSGQTLLVEDLIVVQSEPGAVVLARAATDGYHELGRLEALSSKTWNYPTLAGNYLLVRNDQEAACYQLPPR